MENKYESNYEVQKEYKTPVAIAPNGIVVKGITQAGLDGLLEEK